MGTLNFGRLALRTLVAGSLLLACGTASAELIIQVGTFNTAPAGGNTDAGFNTGNRFVVKTNYTPTDAVTRNIGGVDFKVIDLNSGANDFLLQVPMEGLGEVYTQTDANHFFFGTNNPTPQIIFDGTAASLDLTSFVGYEFEGDFTNSNPAGPTTGNFAELYVSVANIDVGGGVIEQQASFNTDMARCSDATCADFAIAIRSVQNQDASPPLISVAAAQQVLAEAGPDLTYDAASTTVTTDASSTNNDLGAARLDKEDFVTYAWTGDGGGALAGSNVDGVQGARAVENVNLEVGLADSGLSNTTDTATWQVVVSEQLTGLGGDTAATDTLTVSYNNTGPSAEAGADIVFNASNFNTSLSTSGASANDDDMAMNALVAGFETLTADFTVDGTSLPGNPQTINSANASNPVSTTLTLLQSGISMTTETNTLDLSVTDFAGASAQDSATISYDNALPQIANASATATGVDNKDLDFALAFSDADNAVNALIAGFEALTVEIFVDVTDHSSFFGTLISGGSQTVGNTDLLSTFGLGIHNFVVNVFDKAGELASSTFDFEVLAADPGQPVPAPATLLLLLAGLMLILVPKTRKLAH